MGLKDWLRLFRAHTAPATVISVLLVYFVGGGQIFTLYGAMVGTYAMLIHWLSFGHNSLMDYKTGYDIKDKHKKHHPLISGEISASLGDAVIHRGLTLFSLIGIVISLSGANPALSISGLLLFYAAGHAYNDGLSKSTIWSFLPITLCFIGLWVWAYFLSAYFLTSSGALVLAYLTVTLAYQIGWEGELKEIEADEANLLRFLGARVQNGIFDPGWSWPIGFSLKLSGIIILLSISENIATMLGALVMVILLHKLTLTRIWDRNKELRTMAVMEIVSLYTLIIAVAPAVEGIFLMTFGILYFVFFNRLLWGTHLTPRV